MADIDLVKAESEAKYLALTKLDNYGHRHLEELTELQLNEYATLLEARRQEVLGRILGIGEGP